MIRYENNRPEIDIFTDVEPDDILALVLLAPFFRFRAIFVVCSENPLWPRLQHLERILNALSIVPDLLLPLGHQDEHILAGLPHLNAHFASMPPRLLLLLASFEPLLEVFKSAPQVLAKLDAVAYGSVNIRWALRRSPDSKQDLLRLINHGFRSLSVFETYFAYGDAPNSFNPTDTPRTCSLLQKSTHPACICLVECIKEWNRFLLASRVDALLPHAPRLARDLNIERSGEIRLTPEARSTLQAMAADKTFPAFTKARVILSIASAIDTQFVAADPGAAILAISLFGDQSTSDPVSASMRASVVPHVQPVHVTIPEAFVVLGRVSQSQVAYFTPLDASAKYLTMVDDCVARVILAHIEQRDV
ncbi:MAG: hypothetical protein K1X67_12415 [Fimbriimonadaceae bacterium]|nr:hypothetical protein [Fimbriimonadaceae bacterium]